ncbi:MAG: hypothetical protein RIT28_146 [Pseudomonadota bacterium]
MTLWMCLVSFAFAAELPEVELGWHGATGWITARPPAGEHVAPEAPVTAELRLGDQRVVVDASGLELQDGLRLALPPGVSSVEGTLSLSLCEDGGTTCRLVNVGFDLPISGWRGRARQPGVALDAAEAAPPMFAVEGAVEAAFARAKSDERLVLLDFSAVWCPPCNLLAAEVLHDPDDAEVLAPFVVAVVDVDAPWSWTLKDRYAVGAYPTLIVTDVDGAVIDRMEGYPGEEAFEAWLTKVQGGMLPLDQLAAKGPTMTPDEAAAAALRLARAGRVDEAKALLPPGLTSADALLTRLALSPDEATLTQLCVLAPERVYEYAFAALDLDALSAEGAATLRATLLAGVARLPPAQGADLLYVLGVMAPTDQQPALFGAAAALLESNLSGDIAVDRGHYGFLADLWISAGQVDHGLALLQRAASAYPEEFTFHHALSGQLLTLGRLPEALAEAELAVKTGYGDNRLRAEKRRAEILVALGRKDEAKASLDAAISAAERPAEGVQVRTTRYLKELESYRAGL